ncbi:protein phosphatase 1 regulatory subunit 12B-like isoform X2 [Amphiprion ocellaris]|uniref:cGMP-dependent protein kinase interacting domain-containing protein n=1 Tax=Amphiprion ocellaris TaxID=80972 RepID=A0AAQ5X1H9_AMPOC|nr:protein phosphatase 1 regulatory subunit 12B-like isoform X2 [Amphiprion ocellaris]
MSSLLSHNKDQPRIRKSLSDSCPASSAAATKSLRHERLSRLGSSGPTDVFNDTSTNHAESYFLRRENRLSARKKAEEETMNNDYKKFSTLGLHLWILKKQMYEKALATNQRLKSRLETSKQELTMIQEQLQRAQNGTSSDCASNMLEAEKKASWSLKKMISDMEEQLKVKAELKTENQRLKDENGALIRVITKLSK